VENIDSFSKLKIIGLDQDLLNRDALNTLTQHEHLYYINRGHGTRLKEIIAGEI
jgi:hypothetical protein